MSDDNISFVEQISLYLCYTKKRKKKHTQKKIKENEKWTVMVTPNDCSEPRKRTGIHEKGGRENKRISIDYYYQTKAKPLNFTLCQISGSLMHLENVTNRRKMLVISIFSFFCNVLYPFRYKSHHLNYILYKCPILSSFNLGQTPHP